MNKVDAVRVKAVRPRICTICRRKIDTGAFYDRYTETDQYGVRQIHKSCLEHDDDDPEVSTETRLLKRIHVDHLKKTVPTGGMFPNADVPPMNLDQEPQTVDTERKVGWDEVPRELKPSAEERPELVQLGWDIWELNKEIPFDRCVVMARLLIERGWRKETGGKVMTDIEDGKAMI